VGCSFYIVDFIDSSFHIIRILFMSNKKKVLIDLTRSKSLFNGQGQFCYMLGNELSKLNSASVEKTYLIRKEEKALFPDQRHFEWLHFYYRITIPRWIRMLFQLFLPTFDLWHITAQDSNFWPISPRTRIVLTIHDLNFLIEAKTESRKRRRLKRLQKRVDRADCITTISNFSANEIKKNLNVGSKPVAVIYNGGIDYTKKKGDGVAPVFDDLNSKFLFTIGVVKPKKNFHVLLPMIAGLEGYKLVIAGDDSDEYANQIRQDIIKLNLEDRVLLLGKVSDNERDWLYANCTAFVFPSLAEGFGIPVIEAMSYKKPVFISKETSLPEVAGDMGFYFDSFFEDSMVKTFKAGMQVFQQDPLFADKLKARSEEFNWSRAAREYEKLYEEI
jgi:glycosyltransferase involved in cell wall biosynthesis